MSERDRRTAAQLLAALARTPDAELGVFVSERLGRDAKVDFDHLKRVKRILNLVAGTLVDTEPADLQRVRYALEDLERNELALATDAAPNPGAGSSPPPAAPPAGAGVPGPLAPSPLPRAPAPSPRLEPRTPSEPSPWARPGQSPALAGASEPIAGARPAQPPSSPPVARSSPPAASPPSNANHAAPGSALEPSLEMATTQAPRARRPKTLPFQAVNAAPPPRSSLEPHPSFGATVAASREADEEALPFSEAPSPEPPSPEPPSPELDDADLDAYARFCAERSLYPDHSAAVRRRYNLADAHAESHLRDYWSRRFASDPSLRQRWLDLCEGYRRQLMAPSR